MVREGRKRSESVRRGLSIGHECWNMRPKPGVAHQRHITILHGQGSRRPIQHDVRAQAVLDMLALSSG
jgi:hypothetical protein